MLNMTNNQPFVFQMDQIYGRAIPMDVTNLKPCKVMPEKQLQSAAPKPSVCGYITVYNPI